MVTVICVRAESWGPEGPEGSARNVVERGWAPRIALEQDRLWVDARGLDADAAAWGITRSIQAQGAGGVHCGVAEVPIVAWAAAGQAESGSVLRVPTGSENRFLAPLPIRLLDPDERLLALLEGVGIETCGALAEIPRESVEVRFGGDAARVWRLARGDDPRRLFRPPPAERPIASLDFVDYVVTDPERLLFTANALLGNLCAGLAERGEHARALRLELPLGNGQRWSRALRPARATADRAVWLRLARSVLERLTVPDAVTGMSLEVEATEPAAAIQGDLFDPGFSTAGAVEAALARLIETHGPIVSRAEYHDHPLPERGTEFPAEDAPAVIDGTAEMDTAHGPFDDRLQGLTLQLLPEPRPVLVETVRRRDHAIPIRYRDGRWIPLATVAGPERISGGQWEEPYAREYFRGVTREGLLVWLFRDARDGSWYLHGWWD